MRTAFRSSGEESLSASLISTNVLPQIRVINTSSRCALRERDTQVSLRSTLKLCESCVVNAVKLRNEVFWPWASFATRSCSWPLLVAWLAGAASSLLHFHSRTAILLFSARVSCDCSPTRLRFHCQQSDSGFSLSARNNRACQYQSRAAWPRLSF